MAFEPTNVSRYDDAKLKQYRENFLRENRPDTYETLKQDGSLEAHLQEKADECRAEARRLVVEGITFEAQAWHWAIRSVLLETEWD